MSLKTNGVKNRQVLICLFFLLFFAFTQSFAAEADIKKVIEKAESLKLYEDNYWHKLLHYKQTFLGYKSTITSENFFLATDGAKNPRAELAADIRAFMNGEHVNEFPARFQWLKNKLESESEIYFSDELDAAYQEVKKSSDFVAAYIIFPAGYLKNPASIFGHTLLLFESAGKPLKDGMTFAFIADAGNDSQTAIALKGLAGTYTGHFVFSPYSTQIAKYSEIESRDIWEYKLILTDEQLDMLLRHTMELEAAHAPYQYLEKNCTYFLVEALEIAYPDSDLVLDMGPVAEPVEAVKLLYNKKLAEKPTYRPSIASRAESQKERLSLRQINKTSDFTFGKINVDELNEVLPTDEEKLIAYNLAVNKMKMRVYSGDLEREKYLDRATSLSDRANTIPLKISDNVESFDYPHLGHDLHRVGVAIGKDDGKLFNQYYFRFASQDIFDIDTGMLKNTQLSFLSGSFTFYPNRLKCRLDEIDLFNIRSVPASDLFFLDQAYDMRLGIGRNQKDKDSDSLALRIKSFYGLSCNLTKWNQVYLQTGFDAFVNPFYKWYVDFIPGAEAGIITSVGRWKQNLYGFVGYGCVSKRHLRVNLSADETIAVARNLMLSANYTFTRDYGDNKHKFGLSAQISF